MIAKAPATDLDIYPPATVLDRSSIDWSDGLPPRIGEYDMDARIEFNSERAEYEVRTDDETYRAVHVSGPIAVCQIENHDRYDCGVFFAGAGGANTGDLRLYQDGDTHEIDGTVYIARDTSGWSEWSE